MNKIYRAFRIYSGNVNLPTWCTSYLKETHLHLFYSVMYVLKTWDGDAWTGLIWLRIGIDGGRM